MAKFIVSWNEISHCSVEIIAKSKEDAHSILLNKQFKVYKVESNEFQSFTKCEKVEQRMK